MKKILAAAALALPILSAFCADAPQREGFVFFHTLRNRPKIERAGKPLNIGQSALEKAGGLRVECGQNQYASFKFSNAVVVVMHPNTALKITEFKQQQPLVQKHADAREAAKSVLKIELENGSIDVIAPEQRNVSVLQISTTVGVFDFKAREFSIEQANGKFKLFMLDGQAKFRSKTDRQDFIRSKQFAVADASDTSSNYPLNIEQFGLILEKNMREKLSACRQIKDSVYFSLDAQNNVVAERIIFKEFLLKEAKYDYRK